MGKGTISLKLYTYVYTYVLHHNWDNNLGYLFIHAKSFLPNCGGSNFFPDLR
jgi:hypothetical protein